METYDLEQAPKNLEAAARQLGGWFMGLGSDYVEGRYYIGRHQLEAWNYTNAAEKIKDIVDGTQSEQLVQLKIGRSAIESVRFHRSAYGFSRMSFSRLNPGTKLKLRKADFVQYRMLDEIREELFAGWFNRLPLSEIARTLHDGGELSIVEVPIETAPTHT